MSLISKDWINEIYVSLTDTLANTDHKITSGITKVTYSAGDSVTQSGISSLIAAIKGLSTNHYIGTYADCFVNNETLDTPAQKSLIDSITKEQIDNYVTDILKICGNQVLTAGTSLGNTNYRRASGCTDFTGDFGCTDFTRSSGHTNYQRAFFSDFFIAERGCTNVTGSGCTDVRGSGCTDSHGASGCTNRARFGTESNSGLRYGNNYRASFNSTCGQYSTFGLRGCREACSRTANFTQSGFTNNYFGNNHNVGTDGNNFSAAFNGNNFSSFNGNTFRLTNGNNYVGSFFSDVYHPATGDTNFRAASGCTDFHSATGNTNFTRASGCTDYTPCPTVRVDFKVIIGENTITYTNYPS